MGDTKDNTIYSTLLKIENKDIFIDLKRNGFGVYLKISERNGTNRNTVLIPSSGILRLKKCLDEVAEASMSSKVVSRERKVRVAANPEIVARSIYVTGITWDTTDEDLSAHYSTAGIVVNAVVLKKRRGQRETSMGCAVVEFQSPEMAAYAVQSMATSQLKGRTVYCREDEPVQYYEDDEINPTPTYENDNKKIQQDLSNHSKKVFIGNLDYGTTVEELHQTFSVCGNLVSKELLMSKKGKPIGSGVVEFNSAAEAAACIAQLDGSVIRGRPVKLREYK
jgi:RNA recognition motif-containing protein